MSNTYFRKKATPIKPQLFPADYLVITDVKGDEVTYMTSKSNFDISEEVIDERQQEIMEQIALAYSREIAIHMGKGNRDHWLFTYEDPDTNKIRLDLVLSQNFLNRCTQEELAIAVCILALFTYRLEDGGVSSFTPITFQSEYKN